MAKFKITPTTTVAELKEQFRNEVGCVLRVYQGRSEASDGATLVSLGAKEGELECRTSRTVGKFEEAFQNELNLKVKVYTKDNWVKVLDGITLAVAGQLPNGMTKARMEEHLSYKRDESEDSEDVENVSSKGICPPDMSYAYMDRNDETIDVSNLDTSEVTNMDGMFAGCSNLKHIDLSNFNTSKVTRINAMFRGCSQLEAIDLSSFDTSKIDCLEAVFSGCSSLETLDLSNFDVSNVDEFIGVFEDCTNLRELNLSNWQVKESASYVDMFCNTPNLERVILTNTSESAEWLIPNRSSIEIIK